MPKKSSSIAGHPVLFITAVSDRTGKPASSIYRDCRNGSFPEPVNLGTRRLCWLEAEVSSWIESRLSRGGAS